MSYKKTMARLIDAEPILKRWNTESLGRKEMYDMVKDAPVIEIVLCKDCKGSEVFQNDSSGVMARYCKAFTLKRMVADDDFCSYGKRRKNE